VCSIVLEVPNSVLGAHKVGIWGVTSVNTDRGWIQADRGGRPLQAVFLPGDHREAYLSGRPVDDDRFIGAFAHTLEHSGGYTHQRESASRHSCCLTSSHTMHELRPATRRTAVL
jgi:hypothetical protein